MKRNKKAAFDYSALEGKIKRYYDTQEAFAKQISLSRTTLNKIINNKAQFTSNDIYVASNLLNINTNDIGAYFFTPKKGTDENHSKGENKNGKRI